MLSEDIKNDNSWVPILSQDVNYELVDTENYILRHSINKYQFSVSSSVIDLIQLIDGNRNIDEISFQYYKISNTIISSDDIRNLFISNFVRTGIIQSNQIVIPPKEQNFLYFKIKIIPEQFVNSIGARLKFLFSPSLLKLFPIIISINICLGYLITTKFTSSKSYPIIIFTYFMISNIIHEIGHASGCVFFGKKPKEIGFGFYLFLPAFYIDLTEIWTLSTKKRIIVNMAGLYFEVLLITPFLFFSYFFSAPYFNQIIFLFVFRIIFNLNPFIRTDGYWILSDYFKIPNLRSDSMKSLRLLITGKYFPFNNLKTNFLIIYGMITIYLISIIFVTIILRNPSNLIYFPKYTLDALRLLIEEHRIELKTLMSKVIIPILIYFIFLKKTFQYFRRKSLSHAL